MPSNQNIFDLFIKGALVCLLLKIETESLDGFICKMEIITPFPYLSYRDIGRHNGCFRELLKAHYINTEF